MPTTPAMSLTTPTTSELREFVDTYTADREALGRRYDLLYSPTRRGRFQAFYASYQETLETLDYERLSLEGRIDHHLLRRRLAYELHRLEREASQWAEVEPLLPVASALFELHESRRRMEPVDTSAVAGLLDNFPRQLETARGAAERLPGGDRRPILAVRAAGALEELRTALERWHGFYAGYDPLFTWWCRAPYERACDAIRTHGNWLREEVAGIRPGAEEPILGDPIGAEGLRADLELEMLPYTPAELIAVGERELAWCRDEMRSAARELGFGEDTRAALEAVKRRHVEPGFQPEQVRRLTEEAIAYVEERDLVTIPPLAREVWRMEMLSPEAQRLNPFFLGGEVIQVSFPTDAMPHADKQMSLRGNNVHFARATVQHELIPGHHLQAFVQQRCNPHRRAFTTPFWTEGWTLHWEMLLWDLGFARSPEDRIGMLFWRMHRAARILFSLRFHLGEMTPDEAVDLLVEEVGHERANAAAEVRRSCGLGYPPLYQAAYMLGGLQLRAIHRETVHGGLLTQREFHDRFLQGNHMPMELVRARLLGLPLPREYTPTWRPF